MLISSSHGALSVTNTGKGDNVQAQVIFLDRQKIPNTNVWILCISNYENSILSCNRNQGRFGS